MKRDVPSRCHETVSTVVLGVNGTQWSPRHAVSGSPFSYSFLLASGELFLSVVNIFTQLQLRPKVFEEASEDARNDEPSVGRPGYVHVTLLALFLGFLGVCWKCFVVHVARRHYNATWAASNPLDYNACRRTGALMWVMWVFFSAAVMHALGAPLEKFGSSVLCGFVYASVGFATPYANAIIETLRSEWLKCLENHRDFANERNTLSSSLVDRSQTQSRSKRCNTESGKNQQSDAVPRSANCREEQSQQPCCILLSFLDLCFWPVVVMSCLLRRGCSKSTTKKRFSPEDIGNLLLFFSVFPFISAVLFSFIACIFLPMDWPTVYVQFPIPLIIGLSVSCLFSSAVGSFVILLLPTCTALSDARGHASPVLQRLMLAVE